MAPPIAVAWQGLGVGVDHEIELAENVIDHGELIGHEEQHVWRAERIWLVSLERAFLDMPHRPTGASGSTEALAFLVDELDWLRSLVVPPTGDVQQWTGLCRAENREAMHDVAWDVAGAKAFGYRVAWCNRGNAPEEELGLRADDVVRTLDELPT